MIDDDCEDEVTTKKKVSKEASKKTPKETKKKVTKKIAKKKATQKKKGLTVKGNIKNLKKTRKNVKVNYETRGLFGVARGNLSFLKNPVKPVKTRGEEFACLDAVQQHFPDPVPQTTANPPQIKKLSTSPKTAPKTTFNEFCKTEAQKTTVKTYPSFTKNFHGSIQINCGYTKNFSNQL